MTGVQSLVKWLVIFSSETGSASACEPGFAEAAVGGGVIYAGNDWGSARYRTGEGQAESTKRGNWLRMGVMNMWHREVIK